ISIIKDQLDWITSQYARQINSPNFEVNPILLLRVLAHLESSYGIHIYPIYLMKDTEAIPYVVKYCNWKLRTAKNIDEFADMYNSGAIDKYVPKFYIIKFKTKYDELINE